MLYLDKIIPKGKKITLHATHSFIQSPEINNEIGFYFHFALFSQFLGMTKSLEIPKCLERVVVVMRYLGTYN